MSWLGNAIEPRTSVGKSQTPMSKRQKIGKSGFGNSWLALIFRISLGFGAWRLGFSRVTGSCLLAGSL
jgi:hypothetical protein